MRAPSPRLHSLLAAVGCAGLTLACRSPEPASIDEKARRAEDERARATTKLEQDGCSVELAGSWTLLPQADAHASSWSAERSDGDEALTVIPMPWKAEKLEAEWRQDLRAVIDLRRDAQTSEGISVSEGEFVGDGSDPGAFYTSVWEGEAGSEGAATIVKASPSLLCVFVLVGAFRQHADAAARAREVLPRAHAAAAP